MVTDDQYHGFIKNSIFSSKKGIIKMLNMNQKWIRKNLKTKILQTIYYITVIRIM